MRPDPIAIPISGILRDPLLCFVIDVDDAEAVGIALCPLEIIHKGPEEIAADICALGCRSFQREQIAVEKINAVWVVDLAVQRNRVVRGHSVFGNEEGLSVTLAEKFGCPIQAFGRNGPLDRGLCRADLAASGHIAALSVGNDGTAVINVLRVEVDGLTDELHILLGDLGEIIAVESEPVLGIFAEQNGIAPP